jgi:hypothetical protein
METYSLKNPTQKASAKMMIRNAEGGRALIEDVLRNYKVSDSEVVVSSETELLLKSRGKLPYEVKEEIKTLCDMKEM